MAALAFALLVAGSFSLGHLAAPYLSSPALNGARFLIATLLLVAIHAAAFRRLPKFPAAPWRFAVLGGLMALYFLLMFVALKISTPVSTGAVFTLIPLMSAAFGWLFLRQTTSGVVMISLMIAAAGAIWVIFRGDLEAIISFRIGRGEAIFIFGCAGHAAVAPLVKKFNRGENGLTFTVGTVTATTLWILLFGASDMAQTNWSALPSVVWFAILYLAVFTTAATFFLVQYASMRLPASKVLSYAYITPAAIIVIEGMIGHGWISWSMAAGAAVTATALLVMALGPDN